MQHGCGKRRVARFQSAVGLRRAYPRRHTFFALTQAGDHGQRAFGGVDRLPDRHPRQRQEVRIGQRAHLQRHQFQQLLAQAALGLVTQFQLARAAFEHRHHSLAEQRFLAGEVVVDGAFGHAGKRGDAVHAGSLVAMDAELLGSGGKDGAAFSVGQAGGLGHARILHSVVYFSKVRYYTV